MGERFDWQEAHRRLERMRERLEGSAAAPGPGESRVLLRRRAEALARPEGPTTAAGGRLGILVGSRAGLRYGLPMALVTEVIPWDGGTPIPGGPGFLAGIVSHRGRVLPVVDYPWLAGVPGDERPARGWVAAVAAEGVAFGILLEEVEGMVEVAAADLAPPPREGEAEWGAAVRGLTPEGIAVLDLAELGRGGRLTVNQRD